MIREVNASTHVITTVAGNGSWGYRGDGGPATSAELDAPGGIALDADGDLFIADTNNNCVREVTASTQVIATFAGDRPGDNDPATAVALNGPDGVAADASGDLFIADTGNNCIREVNAATGLVTTVAGSGFPGHSGDGGPATAAELHYPGGIAVDASGDLFIADTYNNCVREVNASTGDITTVAGNGVAGYSGDGGQATNAELDRPCSLAVDADGNLFIADEKNNCIREVNATTGVITTVAGNGTGGFSGDGGLATSAELDSPDGIAVDSGGDLFIADTSNNRIREVNATTHVITTVAGNGTAGYSGDGGQATNAELYYPASIALDASGDLFIADTCNHRIREVNASTGVITTVAGSASYGYGGDGGQATAAQLLEPCDVALDSIGDLFILDEGVVRKVVLQQETINVAAAVLTVTAGSASKTYGQTLSFAGTEFTTSGLVNGDSVTGVTLTSTGAAASTAPGSYAIVPTSAVGSDLGNYTITYVPGSLTVTPAPLTITADDQSMVYGAALPSLTASFSGFVNGDSAAKLTAQPQLTTTATVDSQVSGSPYSITVGGAADPDYTITYVPGSLTVTPAPLTITADDQNMVYGAALPALTASFSGFVNGDSAANLTAQPQLTTTATVGSQVSGSPYSITVRGAADPDYTITYVPGSLTVTPAPLTITADDQSMVYGAALPALTASFSGFVNGDSAANLTAQPQLTTTATVGSQVSGSPYSITVRGAADPDYTITYVPGSLTVTPAPLTITADDQSMVYGAALPALTASFSGFVNGDSAANLTAQPQLTTMATVGDQVSGSPYSITVGGAADPDYTITYVPGSLTVTPAPLTITADDQNMVYGAALPALTASFSGFVNGDSAANLTAQPQLTTTATVGSQVSGSPYSITVGGAADPDYTVTYVPGSLTVTPALLTITADDQNMVYGAALPALTASFSGFVNGDSAANLTAQPQLTTTATVGSQVSGSPYSITVGGAADPDYTITYVPGSLTVTPATLTVTADDQTRVYGAADPLLTASFSGFVNGETLATSGISGVPSLTAGDTAASPVGSYAIVAAQGTLAAEDYTFSFVNGTLTVTQEVMTVDGPLALACLEASGNLAVVVDSGGDLTVNSPVTLDADGAVSVVQTGRITVPGINARIGRDGHRPR